MKLPFAILPRFLRSLLLAGAGMLTVGLPGVGAADWQSLVNNSPFGQTTTTAAGPSGQVEFRAVVQEDGAYLVNLYNPVTKSTDWIPVNGSGAGIDVKSYDPASDRLQIIQGGKPLTLSLKQPKVAFVAQVVPPPVAESDQEPGKIAGPADKADRRAEIRALIQARMEGGNPGRRALPPEAQAMIEEFRRRRAGGAGTTSPPPPPNEP